MFQPVTNTVIRIMLGLSLLGLAGANAATTDFNVTGAVSDGSVISGTLTIDTTAGAVTAANVSLGPPASVTCSSINFQTPAGSVGYALDLNCTPGNTELRLVLRTPNDPVSGTLAGYTGGQINTDTTPQTFSFYKNSDFPVTSGSLAAALVAPTLAKSFTPSTIAVNGISLMTFTITNPNTTALSTVAFSDTLPAGVSVAAPVFVASTCSGVTLTGFNAGSTSVNVSIASLAGGASCTASTNVTGTTSGVKVNTTSAITALGPNGGPAPSGAAATATLTVLIPPTISKSFADSQIELFFGSTALSFTVTNPNAATTLTNVSFTDTLPAGLIVSTPSNGLTGSCGGGAITAAPGSNSISLSGASLAGGASCTFSVNVLGEQIGVQTNTTSTVSAGPGNLVGNAATASVTVVSTEFMWFFFESGGGGLPRP